jgi:ABC-2 type transport system ATP-binding protein
LTTHNLPEADELCDLVAVFRTKLLRVDTPDNLRIGLFGRGTEVLVAGDAARWVSSIKALAFVRDVTVSESILSIALDNPDEQNPVLVQTLVQAGAGIRSVAPIAHSLEDVYLELLDSASPKSVAASVR